MKAFILAAGLGTRLWPLTNKIPKPMLKVGDKPLLVHQINLLKKYGVTECAMNLYYLPRIIKNYFGDGKRFGMKIRYLRERKLSGTAGPIKKMANFFSEPFVVMYGDNLTDINLQRLYQYHLKTKAMATIALYYEPHPESKGIVNLGEKNRIINFKEKPKVEEIDSYWANAGIYICQPEILKYIPRSTFYDFGRDLFPLLLKKDLPLYGYKMTETLLDIGTPETYRKAQKVIKNLNI